MRGGPGYGLLSREERLAFRDRMHDLETLAECNALVAQMRQVIETRAREKGITPPPGPNAYMCERMKARGMID